MKSIDALREMREKLQTSLKAWLGSGIWGVGIGGWGLGFIIGGWRAGTRVFCFSVWGFEIRV